ncbi:MAG: VOC family protein [Bacteriovoracaceae bacterium]
MLESMLYDFVEKCLKDLRPYLEPHWEIDHVCYRTKSLEDYVKTKNSFSKIGYLLGETCIGGRPIACFELHSPVMTSQGLVSLVEVPAPKPGRKIDSGYEHLEVVIDCTFEALMMKFSNLSWDTRANSKGFNNEIEAKFSDFNVKFHHHALNHIIEVEKNTDAYELVLKLQNFSEYSPQVAGTIPLGIATEGSDLDVLMKVHDFDKLANDILKHFPGAKIKMSFDNLTANFYHRKLPVEFYAEKTLSLEQKAYRHLRIEGRLLKLLGSNFKKQIIKLKSAGLKTEPVFGKLLGFSHPYDQLLDLYWLSDQELLGRFSQHLASRQCHSLGPF